ncbi:MAG: high frequency lysogenization protein HflD [Pseudomonadales bacterium]|jgi:high frequency lysogenization protein|nr:high frequency lysogenization protein HflD [Pseudomonadales bacterium]MCC6528832.1 high frequency lysogenization protein HflD [Pseudomonadales bacterium]MCP5333344.1 high frequency lysogenization protein HflD [Pseudomonadales bacterium]HMU90415.1 high frequency lysogenization protein HflD [Pseudomonadales bacterium]HMW15955.1 high frequency lysogenization protein HflD [Pseudomonadales bacterium]
MARSIEEQALAFAALLQFAQGVDRLARTGVVSQSNIETAVTATLCTHPASTEAVFGGLSPILPGLRLLSGWRQNGKSDEMVSTLRYAVAAIHLQGKLAAQPRMLDQIGQELVQIGRQQQLPDFDQAALVGQLSRLYQQSLSTLRFRIQVVGEPRHLQNSEIADKIRLLLFAAVRSAMLWRQLGGRPLFLLWQRRALINTADRLLQRH